MSAGGSHAPPRWGPPTPSNGSQARSRARTYPATKSSVARARRELARWLTTGGVDELLLGDVAVAVSEACTNVVVHAYPEHTAADGRLPLFRVTARRVGEAITVTVADAGSGMRPRPDSPGIGLGLPVIAALTDHVDVRSGADGLGTVVSMLFTAAGARTRTPMRSMPATR